MIKLSALFFLLLFYLLGCINGAYYIGKKWSNQDIRTLGSTNAGARNAGRIFGRSAFIYTVIIDGLKVIVPLLVISYYVDLSEFFLGCLGIALLLGHIWPAPLQFRGGKGVVVYLAAALVLAPLTLIAVGLTLVTGLKIKHNFTVIGLIGLCTIPIVLIFLMKYMLAATFSIMLIIVIIAHRKV